MPIPAFFPALRGGLTRVLPRLLLSGAVLVGAGMVLPGAGQACAQAPSAPAASVAASAVSQFTLTGVRPEALSWWWDNIDATLLRQANAENQAFRWLQPPASPQHLGYSAGAVHESRAYLAGAVRTIVVTYLDPRSVQARVASDNFLGAKPYSFLAARVSIDGHAPFTLLAQYNPVGSAYGDSRVRLEATDAADVSLAQAYVEHFARTLKGLAPKLTDALNERYFNAVLKSRGTYQIGAVDRNLNVTLTIVQEIRGITPEMLAWWWDHIGNTERYRLWQPIDHVSFEWTVPPTNPDMAYDIGAVQKVKEYIGRSAWTLSIKGADPHAAPLPPVPVQDPGYFYARTNVTLLDGLLPSNSLVHQWRPNAAGDGVVLTSTFVNTALALVLNGNFFHDLGSHALREFQMLPYFLPRLYRREALGE